jgi:hypothetical protein
MRECEQYSEQEEANDHAALGSLMEMTAIELRHGGVENYQCLGGQQHSREGRGLTILETAISTENSTWLRKKLPEMAPLLRSFA